MKTIPIILFIGSLLLACSKEGGDEDVFDRIDLVRVITPDFLNSKEPYYFIDKYRISGDVLPFNRFSIDLNVYYPSVVVECDKDRMKEDTCIEDFDWCLYFVEGEKEAKVAKSHCLNYDLYEEDLDVFKFIEEAFKHFESFIYDSEKAFNIEEYLLKSLDIEIGATFFKNEPKEGVDDNNGLDKEKLYIVFFFENPNQTEYLQIFATYDGEKDVFELENILP